MSGMARAGVAVKKHSRVDITGNHWGLGCSFKEAAVAVDKPAEAIVDGSNVFGCATPAASKDGRRGHVLAKEGSKVRYSGAWD